MLKKKIHSFISMSIQLPVLPLDLVKFSLVPQTRFISTVFFIFHVIKSSAKMCLAKPTNHKPHCLKFALNCHFNFSPLTFRWHLFQALLLHRCGMNVQWQTAWLAWAEAIMTCLWDKRVHHCICAVMKVKDGWHLYLQGAKNEHLSRIRLFQEWECTLQFDPFHI